MCGIVGTYNVPDSAGALRLMLHGLQNRGRQAAGIVTFDGNKFSSARFPGTVSDNFSPDVLAKLLGSTGIGHTRYATAPDSAGEVNIQPFCVEVGGVPITFCHNGNFTNVAELEKNQLSGVPFLTHSDSERFFSLVLKENAVQKDILASIASALTMMRGVCSGVMASPNELIAIRDSWGTRPLYYAPYGNGYVVASETCALDDLGVFDWHEVPPGTLMSFSPRGIRTLTLEKTKHRYCSFEWVYFAFPTSTIFGVEVAAIRKAFGAALASEHPVDADVVVGIPDSSTLCAIGYAQESGIPHDQSLLVRKHNTGRTFTLPVQSRREKAVGEKFSFGPQLKGKRIVLIDDSIVRGTTTRKVIAELRHRGVAEIHVRIGSPQVTGPCHYGINTAKRELLLAARFSKEEMRREIGADSLEFLSMERFKQVIKTHSVSPNNCCFACMDGKYFHT